MFRALFTTLSTLYQSETTELEGLGPNENYGLAY